jgi:hypothetical protein
LPAHFGHLFACGPETFSIFSNRWPQRVHWYSYRGTGELLHAKGTKQNLTTSRLLAGESRTSELPIQLRLVRAAPPAAQQTC